ncbi:hypothetical protein IQ07DRAFT_589976 [Pyrenochaeta sp. DS3sAY3a]|nr:hypothetical protein IQ07DRAFT_589976 [Pyrenochaeta sp. DS3sAY3a]
MAAPRIANRHLLSRLVGPRLSSSTIFATTRGFLSQRSFASSTKLWQDFKTPSDGSHTRSVALLMLPRRATKSEIEALLKSKGCDIKRMQIRLDKFTFHNDTMCFVELGSEQQAADAVESLNNSQFQASTIIAKILKPDFVWGPLTARQTGAASRYFFDEGNGAEEAVRPLLEGRRKMLSVQTPGWGDPKGTVSEANATAIEIIHNTFDKYGLECVGSLRPFYGDKKSKPRMLCHLDFKTIEGAEKAVRDLDDTEIAHRRTWVKNSEPSAWRAHQIGKVNPALLTQLQEAKIAPEETYDDLFNAPKEDRPSSFRRVKVARE